MPTVKVDEARTINKFMVGVTGDDIIILQTARKMSKADALNPAAWLVALADIGGDEFPPLLKAVRNT